nr:hypothetical protein [Tanacetum cinerariifolium]
MISDTASKLRLQFVYRLFCIRYSDQVFDSENNSGAAFQKKAGWILRIVRWSRRDKMKTLLVFYDFHLICECSGCKGQWDPQRGKRQTRKVFEELTWRLQLEKRQNMKELTWRLHLEKRQNINYSNSMKYTNIRNTLLYTNF